MDTIVLAERSLQVSNLSAEPITNSKCELCFDGWILKTTEGVTQAHACECQVSTRIARRIPAKYSQARLADFKGGTIDAVASGLEDVKSPGLFLFGEPGVGKTHLAVAICRVLLEAKADVLLRSAARFYRELRGAFNADRTEEAVFSDYKRPPWLLLDDIGSGALSDFERRYFLDLLDQRADRRTIITSNLSAEDFSQRLDARIGSRLSEFTSIRCAGSDRRAMRGKVA